MKRTKRWFYFIFLPIGIVGVVVLASWLLLGRETERPFSATYSEATGQVLSYSLQQGLSQDENLWQRDLPLYTFCPGEGWEQIQDAAEQANQFSLVHQDVYRGEGVATLTFTQQFAVEGDTIPAGQEVLFGDTQLIFCQQEESSQELGYKSQIYWVQGDSLLSLSCSYGPDMHLNEMLELVKQVDYQTLRQPVYSNLSLERGYMRPVQLSETVSSTDTRPCRSQGNPKIPDHAFFVGFSRLPEGFAEMTSYQSVNNSNQHPNYITQGFYNQNNNQQQILLHCWLGSNQMDADGTQSGLFLLSNVPDENIQDAAVHGNPALLYIDKDCGFIGWVDDYRTVELDVMYPISRNELIALAESLVQKPVQEEKTSSQTQ